MKFQFLQTNIINSKNSTYLIACSLDWWFNSCNWEFIATCKISNFYQWPKKTKKNKKNKQTIIKAELNITIKSKSQIAKTVNFWFFSFQSAILKILWIKSHLLFFSLLVVIFFKRDLFLFFIPNKVLLLF